MTVRERLDGDRLLCIVGRDVFEDLRRFQRYTVFVIAYEPHARSLIVLVVRDDAVVLAHGKQLSVVTSRRPACASGIVCWWSGCSWVFILVYASCELVGLIVHIWNVGYVVNVAHAVTRSGRMDRVALMTYGDTCDTSGEIILLPLGELVFRRQLIFTNIRYIEHISYLAAGPCLLIVKMRSDPLIVFGCICAAFFAEAHELFIIVLNANADALFDLTDAAQRWNTARDEELLVLG